MPKFKKNSSPFTMKGWSPFTKKTDPTSDKKEFMDMFNKDTIESIEREGEYTYDKSTKSWISTKTGKPVKPYLDLKTGERVN
jgi:hypothetical protein